MAKTYGGRIRRTGRGAKKRTQRIVAKSKSTSLVGKPGLNVSAAKSARFFASMPPILRFKLPWYADTAYNLITGVGTGAYLVLNGYFFIDPLTFNYAVNSTGTSVGTRAWYSSELKGLFYQYQEGRFRTHQLHYDFTVWLNRDTAATAAAEIATVSADQPPFQLACAPVPLSYLRNATTGNQHAANDAGNLFAGGIDYFSVLTKTSGTRQYTINNMNTRAQGSMIIDGFEHNGQIQSMTCTHTQWAEAADQPVVTYNYPNPGLNRQVYLFAFRFPYLQTTNSSTRCNLRAAYRLDQHMEFLDKNPAFPYLSGAVNAAV